MPSPYLLDTTVLLHWTRNSPQAQAIDTNFQLSSSAMRPLICEVSLGEMLAFSLSRKLGPTKATAPGGDRTSSRRRAHLGFACQAGVRRAVHPCAIFRVVAISRQERPVGWRCGARCRRTSLDDGHGLPSTPRKDWLADYRTGRQDRASSRIAGRCAKSRRRHRPGAAACQSALNLRRWP